jgi:hypothetical protein
MLKSDLLRALQPEIRHHTFDTFVDTPPSIAQGGNGVVTPGCPGLPETAVHAGKLQFH